MPPAAAVVGHHRVGSAAATPSPPAMVSEIFAKDAILAWFRGEFAAANAIIDALCNHITQLEGERSSEYESVFAAIHRRRLNWIPILQMQKYCSIVEVTLDLRKVAERKIKEREEFTVSKQCDTEVNGDFADMASSNSVESSDNGGSDVVDGDSSRDDSHDSPESVTTDIGSQTQPMLGSVEFCSNHENCGARPTHMKMTKGFVSKEPLRGHMVNVVRGLKLFEDIFTPNEISKLHDLVNKLRVAGQNGDLSGGSCDSWHSYSWCCFLFEAKFCSSKFGN